LILSSGEVFIFEPIEKCMTFLIDSKNSPVDNLPTKFGLTGEPFGHSPKLEDVRLPSHGVFRRERSSGDDMHVYLKVSLIILSPSIIASLSRGRSQADWDFDLSHR
jgi:hypothetical protein